MPTYVQAAENQHPRILLSDSAMVTVKQRVEASDELTCLLHSEIMSQADASLAGYEKLVFKLDASGKRLLTQSRHAILRISSCAYAYRYTGEKKYLESALADMREVCSWPNWNEKRHFLDPSEMALAVAIGYDWLYDEVPQDLRDKARQMELDHALAIPGFNYRSVYDRTNNWNQVCNAGLAIASLAFFEPTDSIAALRVAKAVESNPSCMSLSYSPDGNYPEGPVYWSYGTMFETLMLTVMRDVLGTDFGLGATPGFDRTGKFETFCYGVAGQMFNFADNCSDDISAPALWWFAWQQHNPSLLSHELELLRSHRFQDVENERFIPLLMAYAARMEDTGVADCAHDTFFTGNGVTPIAIVHTGWTGDDTDRYLAIKAGTASAPHGHMDAGTFVYDAKGCRWSMDMDRQNYAALEVAMAERGGSLWDTKQNSLRWQLFRYNNHQHSTLTINDKDHEVKGFASIVDTCGGTGARLDMTPVFAGEAAHVGRTVRLVDGKWLETVDSITALPSKDAVVRWNLVTPADVKVCRRGLVLAQNGRKMVVKAHVKGCGKVTYRTWSADPADYDGTFSSFEQPQDGVHICGYEVTVPANCSAELRTEMK